MPKQEQALDWAELGRFIQSIQKQYPFHLAPTLMELLGINNNQIKIFVQDMLKNMIESTQKKPAVAEDMKKYLDYEMIETKRWIYIHFKVPKKASVKKLKVFLNQSKVKITNSGMTEIIVLSHDVIPGQSTAKWKDGILKLHMPKKRTSKPYRNIVIQHHRFRMIH